VILGLLNISCSGCAGGRGTAVSLTDESQEELRRGGEFGTKATPVCKITVPKGLKDGSHSSGAGGL